MPHDHYEDIEVGEETAWGSYEVTREEILEFGKRWDPQPIHVDEEAAEQSYFGGLIASGWHTAGMTMRMIVDNYLNDSGAIGAAGVDELRWLQPVRPGDTLRVENRIEDKRPWGNGLGIAEIRTTTYNQDEEPVMTWVGLILFPMREE